MSYTEIVAQIRELLGRNLNPIEISNRLHLDIKYVEQAIMSIKT
jgi:hypothetical protein